VCLTGGRLESKACGRKVDGDVIARTVMELYRLWFGPVSLKVSTCAEGRRSEVL